jgi:two-component system OmpR family sensor kinase
LLFLLLAIGFFAVLQGLGAYRSAVRQADELFDQHLRQMAHAMRPGGPPPWGAPAPDDSDFEIQIWGPDGVQLFRSPRSELPQSAVLGFSDVTVQGTSYRVYTVQTPLQTVQIAQDMSARNARASVLALRAVLPVALMAPLLMIVVWWVVSASLAPLERARRQVARRGVDDFSALPVADLPSEVRPLVDELNLLFSRVQTAFEAQRNFVADAAHELRSPLTALKLQAQALERQQDPEARRQGAERLHQGIDRAIRLMQQLLLLARQEAAPMEGARMRPVDLQAVARQVLTDLQPLAHARGIDLGLQAASPAPVAGDADALAILLRNLLENALKYTPAPGRVDLWVGLQDGQPLLRVEDAGPGMPPDELPHAFERFFRGAQALAGGGGDGSGLGLAIVQAIARRHQATVALGRSERLGGLQATVRFPVAQQGVS